ncbi:hypothetical protein RF11_09142 [Thelohanellus kitauei]|uniref:Uncharacterized protein n=1 Tax=Thelohanellus kitauei TaxID=669202 RepID=A0A0C2N4E4_THEKT|nr:hypothetical protein RF11_09142 [Thelohanellus kitauei]
MKKSKCYSNEILLKKMIFHIPYCSKPPPTMEPCRVSPKDFDQGCPFYYLNTLEDGQRAFKNLLGLYKNRVPDFVPPDVIALRKEFKGMDAFMFSETFLDFLMECFVKWYRKPELWKRDSPDLILFILLILCLILRVSKDRSICDSYRKRMFDFFGPCPKLENRSLLDITKELPNCRNPLVAAMIKRVISLSHLGRRNTPNQ